MYLLKIWSFSPSTDTKCIILSWWQSRCQQSKLGDLFVIHGYINILITINCIFYRTESGAKADTRSGYWGTEEPDVTQCQSSKKYVEATCTNQSSLIYLNKVDSM